MYVTCYFSAAALDYDIGYESFDLIVSVSDGQTSLDTTTHVEIRPVNEYDPVLTVSVAPIDITEDLDIGRTVFVIDATDDDRGIGGILTYHFLGNIDHQYIN